MAEANTAAPTQQAGDVLHLSPEDRGVIKKIITVGEDGPAIETGQEVLVHYTGRLTDGTVFDSSIDKEALKINIGVGQVIKGWDLGIMSMKLGEKAELTIKAEYGYGAMTCNRCGPQLSRNSQQCGVAQGRFDMVHHIYDLPRGSF